MGLSLIKVPVSGTDNFKKSYISTFLINIYYKLKPFLILSDYF